MSLMRKINMYPMYRCFACFCFVVAWCGYCNGPLVGIRPNIMMQVWIVSASYLNFDVQGKETFCFMNEIYMSDEKPNVANKCFVSWSGSLTWQ